MILLTSDPILSKIPLEIYEIIFNEMVEPFSITVKGDTLYANKAMADLVGVDSPMDLIGTDSLEWVHKEDQDMVNSLSTERKKGKKVPDVYRFRIVRRDGQIRNVETVSRSFLIDDQMVSMGIVRDVQETIDLIQRESEQRQILDAITDSITIRDMEYNLIWANKAEIDSHGGELEDILGKKCYKAGFGLDNPCDDCLVGEVLKSGKGARGLKELSNGKFFDIKMDPIYVDGNITGLIEIARDVTEQVLQEKQLEERAWILDSISESVIVTDMEGVIEFWNKGAEQIWGYSAEEMIGNKTLVLGLSKESAERELQHVINRGTYNTSEWTGKRKDGTQITVVLSTNTIRSGDTPTGIIGVSHDITEIKRLQKEQQVNREALVKQETEMDSLREIERLKTEFMNTATHEIRTPITSIKGYTELILEALDQGDLETTRAYFNVVTRNVERLEILSNDLLDMQRIESGRIELSIDTCSAEDLLNSVESELLPIINHSSHNLVVEGDRSLLFNCDIPRLNQVVSNLIDNAVKYSPDGSTVTVNVSVEDGNVVFSVTDEGVGLTVEEISKLFVPFPDLFVEGVSHGSGLGLSISKGIVELHGGRIWVESEGRNKGATFSFSVPISQ